ncbi:hypothetical protein [Balneatrix alpica]|uniref:Uncharacterized protein n=1 Tax=Balneatrix alpica TaxID=75684 RepID=A0ABV5ZAI1_9GAMM|nr:hypothetical protein [Balneatrix alpica]
MSATANGNRTAQFQRTLSDYFRQRLDQCAAELDSPPQTDTLWYMGALLARFGESQQLFSFDEGRLGLRPLALLYKDAQESGEDRQRCLILRQLGDQALFIGALFPQRYARRGLGQDYFIGMGGGAYDYLAEHAPSHQSVFAELAERFAACLQLVAQACYQQARVEVEDVLQLYQQWQRSRDPQLARQLQQLGISLEGDEQRH